MTKRTLRLPVLALIAIAAWGQGANAPYKVHDTKPVITHGPILLNPSETGVSILWTTDTPSHSKVLYGTDQLDQVAEPFEHGFLPVGTRHLVHLTGLLPGRAYKYQIVSTRVVKLKGYWPEKGLNAESGPHSFKTLDRAKAEATFAFITDTHEDVARVNALLGMIDWTKADFLVHGGDAFHTIESEDHLFERWLDPAATALKQSVPLIWLRGNHETRGAFVRELAAYVAPPEGRFYFARDHGPVHVIVIDSGEDKPDSTNVYGGLNNFAAYRRQEFDWFSNHVKTADRVRSAPFKVILVHQPGWGYVEQQNDKWVQLANEAGADLIISGHTHRFSHRLPKEGENRYHHLVVGQDQVAMISANKDTLTVTVTARDGKPVESFTLTPRR
jgi:predicted phosphodiesterase